MKVSPGESDTVTCSRSHSTDLRQSVQVLFEGLLLDARYIRPTRIQLMYSRRSAASHMWGGWDSNPHGQPWLSWYNAHFPRWPADRPVLVRRG
jgi:hypothetical protein